jgi:hypothetical protein
MVQQVELENGEVHEFPDEATPQMIRKALAPQIRQSKIERFKKVTGIGQPSLGQDYVAGMVHGLTSNIPDMQQFVPENFKDIFNKSPDVYKSFGTEDKPFNTLGGAAQLAGELTLPVRGITKGATNLVSKAIESASSGKAAKQFMEGISGGDKNKEELSKSIANDIREKYNQRKEESLSNLHQVNNLVGKDEIYQTPNPLITTSLDKHKQLMKRMEDSDIDAGSAFKKFKEKPTFENAHDLQSELGVMLGDLMKQPEKTKQIYKQIESLKNVRDSLKNDISDFLDKKSLEHGNDLSGMYKNFSDYYRDHVVPYLSDRKIRSIVRGGKETVKNIHTSFDTPTDIIDPMTGEKRIGAINKILQDLPDSVKGKILASKTNIFDKLNNTESLSKAFNRAKTDGYSTYFNDEVENSLANILKKQANKETYKKIGKYSGISAIPVGIGIEELLRRKLSNES